MNIKSIFFPVFKKITSTIINKHMNECFKRIVLDIKDLKKSPIEGAYYYPNEDNILKGQALVFGPKGTPYENGNYIFSFSFTKKYPYEPPILTYQTNDGITRFNPNFYRNGKVCLSVLNTWEGDQWSACQSIRSILVTLQMTFNENPLLNEPGIHWKTHNNYIQKYNQIIQYKNIEVSILNYVTKKMKVQDEIYQTIMDHFKDTKEELMKKITELCESHHGSIRIELTIYHQKHLLDYEDLKNQIKLN